MQSKDIYINIIEIYSFNFMYEMFGGNTYVSTVTHVSIMNNKLIAKIDYM